MRRHSTRVLLLSAALCVVLGAMQFEADAHHAFAAEFDASEPVLLRGKVTKIRWINPHSWVHIAVVGEDGMTQEWMVEGGTPNALMRTGINRQSLPVGTEIVVRGYRSKDGTCNPACKANGRDMTFPDGRKLFMGSSGTGAPRDGADPREQPR